MFVRDVMVKKVTSVNENDTYSKIVKLLIRKKISGVPVINKNNKVVGVISEKDLFHALFPSQKVFYKDPDYYMNFGHIENDAVKVIKLKAKKIMSKKVISITSDDSVVRACSLFLVHNIRRLPVIDNGKLVGIITTNNIYKNFLIKVVS